jgi:anti-sigma factor RsiW
VTRADNRHLAEDRLLDLYFARQGEPAERTDAEGHHLETCEACASRFGKLVSTLDEVRAATNAEADQVFDDHRLAEQRAHILSRLEHAGHPARVIPFPAHSGGSFSVYRPAIVRRWIAAAAVAGLVIGLSTGYFVNWRPGGRTPEVLTTQTREAAPRVGSVSSTPVSSHVEDEDFLSLIDEAIFTTRAPELRAIDAYTPRLRQAALIVR